MFHCGYLLLTWKTHRRLKFHVSQINWNEIYTEVSFTSPEVMWTLIMKLPETEVKFCPKMIPQATLSSVQVSCKRALRILGNYKITYKSKNFIELLFSARSLPRNEKNLMKNRNWTCPIVNYFTWKLDFVSNILWVIVSRNSFLLVTRPRPL